MEERPSYDKRVLFDKFIEGRCSEQEMRWLLDYFAQADPADLDRLVRQALEEDTAGEEVMSEERQTILDNVHGRLSASIETSRPRIAKPPFIRRLLPYAAALVLLSIGIFWYNMRNDSTPVLTSQYGGDVQPGTNRARLVLADGRTIDLSDSQTGIIIGGGNIIYDGDSSSVAMLNDSEASVGTLILTTPKGGTYQTTLPDGTRVWLNAASTLRYPNRFVGGKREVQISGEGYFSVVEDKSKPFIVISQGQEIEVLGTAFNISAYPDESETKTTLVEGSVRLRMENDDKEVSLLPGEQGVLVDGGISKQAVDVFGYTAWKDGLIVLKDASMPVVIRQIERWYDVEFTGASRLSLSGALSGELPRDIPLSEILQALEMHVDATFKIEGRRVIVEK